MTSPGLATPTVPPDLRLGLPARRESIGVVRHVLTGLVDDGSISREALSPVLLAVSEAATDAVIHSTAEGRRFAVCLWLLTDDLVRIAVTDDGPHLIAAPDGDGVVGSGSLGLPTITAIAQAVELRRDPGGRTELVMVFALPRRPQRRDLL